jgi:hypothetical protein
MELSRAPGGRRLQRLRFRAEHTLIGYITSEELRRAHRASFCVPRESGEPPGAAVLQRWSFDRRRLALAAGMGDYQPVRVRFTAIR